MRLLIEFTPHGGTLQRISNEDIPLTHQWFSYVFSFSSFRLDLNEYYGGYASPSFSDITVSPDAFASWPPSGDALFKVMLTDSTEAAAVTIFNGYGTPKDFDREGVSYDLTVQEYSDTITSGTSQSGTLLALMTTYCSTLSLTIDSSNARATSPAVDYTPTSDTPLIDIMMGMCSFFTHGFKIIDGTLFLFDMLATGTTKDLTGFDVLPCSYGKADPVSLVKCSDYSVAGSSAYGKEVSISTAYHTTQSLIEAALTNIKTLIESDITEIDAMLDQTTVTVLDNITLVDKSTVSDTLTTAKVTSTLYNFDDYTVQIEAVGAIS